MQEWAAHCAANIPIWQLVNTRSSAPYPAADICRRDVILSACNTTTAGQNLIAYLLLLLQLAAAPGIVKAYVREHGV